MFSCALSKLMVLVCSLLIDHSTFDCIFVVTINNKNIRYVCLEETIREWLIVKLTQPQVIERTLGPCAQEIDDGEVKSEIHAKASNEKDHLWIVQIQTNGKLLSLYPKQ